jgi:hypothetical protein
MLHAAALVACSVGLLAQSADAFELKPATATAQVRSQRAEPSPVTNRSHPPNIVPIELEGDRPPILTLKVNGVSVRVRFDSGDRTALVLQQSVLDSIHAVPTGESVKLQGLDGFFEVPLFKVARVELGTASFTDIVARLDSDRAGYKPDESTRGFLGTTLLKSYQVVIDYPHRRLILMQPASGDSAQRCAGTSVPFAMNSPEWRGEPFTEAETDLGRVILGWDTGAFTSVLRQSFVESAQGKQSGAALTTRRFILGGRDFGPQHFQIWNLALPHFDGFVGNDFFATHITCLDFPARRIRVSQPGRLP